MAKGESIGLDMTSDSAKKSFEGLVTIWPRWNKFGSELVMVNGDIFLEGYFRQQRYQTLRSEIQTQTFSDYTRAQPWFEWNVTKNTYELKSTGGQERLLTHMKKILGKNVTLYRGLSGRQADIINLVGRIRKGAAERNRS
jgi:hypothetical protein